MYYLGIDIGGTKCAVVLGKIIANKISIISKIKMLTIKNDAESMLSKFCTSINQILLKNKLVISKITAIGISCGSPLDTKKGIINNPPNLPGWNNIPICDILKSKYNIPVFLQNDANACAIAEHQFGVGRGSQNMLFLTFGTGLGAGLILNGKLYSGACNMAGELGHIRLTKTGPIGCNKSGSFEGYCSGAGIANLAKIRIAEKISKNEIPHIFKLAGYDGINAKLIAELAMKGDQFCKGIYAESGRKLGQGLSIIIDLLNPELIVIGSIFARAKKLILPYAMEIIEKETLLENRKACKIVPAQLGEKIGDIAAICVAAEY